MRDDLEEELLRTLRTMRARDDQRIEEEIKSLRQANHKLRSDITVMQLELGSDLTEHITGQHMPLATRVAVAETRLESLDKDVEDSQVRDRNELMARAKWWETPAARVVGTLLAILMTAMLGGWIDHVLFAKK